MIKLDLYDRKILAELDVNARVSSSKIAKKVRLPKETVNYRVKRLLDSNYINCAYTLFNTSKIGYTAYKIFVKFKNLDPKMEDEVVDFIKKNHSCTHVLIIQGYYDLFFLTMQRNLLDLKGFLNDFYHHFGQYVLEKEIHRIVTTHKINQKFLFDAPSVSVVIRVDEGKNIALDKIDQQIIALISADARIKLIDIAAQLNIDPRIIRYRIKKLEEQNIIAGYAIEMNLDSLNQQMVELNISLQDLDAIPSIIEFFDQAKVCSMAQEMIGKYDLNLELYVKDDTVLKDLIGRFRVMFAANYLYFDISHVYREFMPSWCPFPLEIPKNNSKPEAMENNPIKVVRKNQQRQLIAVEA